MLIYENKLIDTKRYGTLFRPAVCTNSENRPIRLRINQERYLIAFYKGSHEFRIAAAEDNFSPTNKWGVLFRSKKSVHFLWFIQPEWPRDYIERIFKDEFTLNIRHEWMHT